mmetsp:Transcript_35293/g.76284  ORF Transcript_35293/g.76284 Transcript_35293/m.76284 type:complete len:448 (+) Transcript_35293:67-1410(+)
MKVKVTVDLSSGLERVPSFNLVVGAKDTVASLKERVATVSLVPFPDQVLSLENQALPDDALLVGCGVEDGSSLVLSAKPSIDTFLRQLEELLSSREMSKDELCLLYCYKHGVSVSQVLKALGLRHLEDLLSRGKSSIQVSSGRWRLGTEARREPKGDLADLGAVNQSSENQRYVDLHNSICSRAFNSKASRALVELVEDLQQILPLHIHQAVKGGSMGKGTATSAGFKRPDAEVVFFLHAANPETLLREKWLPPLLKASADILKSKYQVELMEDSLRLHSLPTLRVTLRFAPAMSLIQTKALAKSPSSWRLFQCSFVEQRVHFVAKQPGSVKMTIRLLKWWRDQQEWSAPLYEPSDEILELIAIHSAQSKPVDQQQAIARVMALLSNFDEVSVLWSNFYTKAEIWAPLLHQKPLLMDPVISCVNHADPKVFDSRELMRHARSFNFFR